MALFNVGPNRYPDLEPPAPLPTASAPAPAPDPNYDPTSFGDVWGGFADDFTAGAPDRYVAPVEPEPPMDVLEQADAILASQEAAMAGPGGVAEAPLAGPNAYGINADQMSRDSDEYAKLRAELLQTTSVTRDNLKYPFAQRDQLELQGGAPAAPWDESMIDTTEFVPYRADLTEQAAIEAYEPPAREEGETLEDYQLRRTADFQLHKENARWEVIANEAALTTNMAHIDRQRAAYEAEVEARANTVDIEAFGEQGAPGERKAGFIAEKALMAGTTEQAEAIVQGATEAARIHERGEKAGAEQVEIAREHQRDQDEATTKIMAARNRLQEQREAMPAPDANRFFNNQTGGQKILTLIGAIAGGLGGSHYTLDAVNAMAQRDWDEQVASLNKVESDIHLLDDAAASSRAMFSELRRSGLDVTSQQKEYKAQLLDSAAAALEREVARSNVEIVRAQLTKDALAVREAADDLRNQVEYTAATAPRTITKRGMAVSGAARKLKMEELGRLGKDQSGAKTRAPGLAVKDSDFDLRVREEARKTQEGAHLKGEERKEFTERQAERVIGNVHKHIAVVDSLDKFLQKHEGSVPAGRTFGTYIWTEEGRDVRDDLRRIAIDILYANSGAVIGEDEKADQDALNKAGWGTEELMGNLMAERERAARKVNGALTAASDEAMEHVKHNIIRTFGKDAWAPYAVTGRSTKDIAKELGAKILRDG